MSLNIFSRALLITASLLAFGAAHAAPPVQQLPRVVISGKAVQQLPRVVVSGLSLAGQQRQLQAQTLLAHAPAAKPAARRI